MSNTPTLYPILNLSRTQAAQALGLGIRKFDELCADPDSGLPRLYIGTRVLFPVELLKDWIANNAK